MLGAILFENTMDREIDGLGSAEYLWNKKGVVPFLKVDKGLAEEANGVQVMKPIPGLDDLLERAVKAGVFGTKMRSVITRADEDGVEAVVDQQFDIGRQILATGWYRSSSPRSTSTVRPRPRPRSCCGPRSPAISISWRPTSR